MMKGWKTWLSVVLYLGLAGFGTYTGSLSPEVSIGFVTTAIGLIGVGHKIEKESTLNQERVQETTNEVRVVYKVLEKEVSNFSSLRDTADEQPWYE